MATPESFVMPRYKLFSRKLRYSSCWNVKRFLMCGKLFHLIHGRDRKNRSSTARNSSSRWCDVTSIIYWAEIVFQRWQLSEGIVTFLQETENNLGSDISNYSNFGITNRIRSQVSDTDTGHRLPNLYVQYTIYCSKTETLNASFLLNVATIFQQHILQKNKNIILCPRSISY